MEIRVEDKKPGKKKLREWRSTGEGGLKKKWKGKNGKKEGMGVRRSTNRKEIIVEPKRRLTVEDDWETIKAGVKR